jgi:hypothetical protein
MLVVQLSIHYFTLYNVLTLFKFLASITVPDGQNHELSSLLQLNTFLLVVFTYITLQSVETYGSCYGFSQYTF